MHFSRRMALAGGVSAASYFSLLNKQAVAKNWPFVCGINCSGLEDTPPGVPTANMLKYYAEKKVKYIRLPGLWEHFQPHLGQELNEDYCKIYEAVLKQCTKLGLSVVCEPCHNYGHYSQDGKMLCFGDGVLTPSIFAKFWEYFCKRFRHHSCIVAWDIMNEPSNLKGDTQQRANAWKDAAQAAIFSVRQYDRKRPIWVEGYGYSSAQAWPTANPTLHTLQDPAKKIVFSAHCYLDRDNSGTHYYWDEEKLAGDQVSGGPLLPDVGIRRIEPFVGWLKEYGLRGNIGECGAGREDTKGKPGNEGWLSALDKTLSYCREQRLPFFYWGTGTDFGTVYPYTLEPDQGKEQPQWQVLRKYL